MFFSGPFTAHTWLYLEPKHTPRGIVTKNESYEAKNTIRCLPLVEANTDLVTVASAESVWMLAVLYS
jgi:hypothetical protein